MSAIRIKWKWIPAVMNVIGLGIAFCVFLVLMSQVWWDFTYDRFKGGKDVYIVEYLREFDGKYAPMILRPTIQKILDSSVDIEAACDYFEMRNDEIGFIQIKNGNGEYEPARGLSHARTETSVLDVFNISLLRGRREDFSLKGDALISESAARRYFPDRDPMGETFIFEWGKECRIVGVYKDRKENETMISGILIHEGEEDLDLPNSSPHVCYVKLAHGADGKAVKENLKNLDAGYGHKNFRLSKLHSYWFMRGDDIFARKTGGNKTLCLILLSIALLFIAIATFNYVNFAMAAIPFSIKDINTRKVYGASRGSLVTGQLLQALGIVGTAFLIGVLAMHTLSGTSWAAFLSGNIDPGKNIPTLLIGGAIALVTSSISGLIPALYSTSFQPALVLKGFSPMGAKGGGLRTATLTVQYVLSFIFIISALCLQRQTAFMIRNDAMGFDHDYVLKMSSHGYTDVKDVEERLRNIPGVVDVTRGDSPMEAGTSSMSEIRDNDNIVQYSFRSVPPEYPGFFKLTLLDGRLPLPGENNVVLVNESFLEALPSYGIGKTLWTGTGESALIIGILKDFHARPFRHDYSPLALFVADKWNFASFMIRVRPDADVKGVLEEARKYYSEMKNLDEEEIETCFLDRDIEKLYEGERRQTALIGLSSILSMLIALVGILGLVWFDTRFMRREIALRKVNGATSGEILSMINRKYIIIVGVSFVIAAPLAYAICGRWMSQFAFRTDIPAWIFLVSLFAVLALTLGVVTLQSSHAASANPSDSLKNE